jgi:hypothetical protein
MDCLIINKDRYNLCINYDEAAAMIWYNNFENFSSDEIDKIKKFYASYSKKESYYKIILLIQGERGELKIYNSDEDLIIDLCSRLYDKFMKLKFDEKKNVVKNIENAINFYSNNVYEDVEKYIIRSTAPMFTNDLNRDLREIRNRDKKNNKKIDAIKFPKDDDNIKESLHERILSKLGTGRESTSGTNTIKTDEDIKNLIKKIASEADREVDDDDDDDDEDEDEDEDDDDDEDEDEEIQINGKTFRGNAKTIAALKANT